MKPVIEKLACMFFMVIIAGCGSSGNNSQKRKKVIVFHAGSLSVPLKEIADRYEKENPLIDIELESAGSVACARKITELNKPCDIMASADYRVIDEMLIPEYAGWNIKFATNSMVLAFNDRSAGADEINVDNWIDLLLDEKIIYGRSDPDSDPCGYRTIMTLKLAEQYYNRPGITEQFMKKDRNMIRPKEVDLLALLETSSLDYIFQYRSVSQQHKLRYIELPREINLADSALEELYNTVSVDIPGKSPGERVILSGSAMVYGITLIEDAPNRDEAMKFLGYILGEEGMKIIKDNGQNLISPCETDQYDLIPVELRSLCLNK